MIKLDYNFCVFYTFDNLYSCDSSGCNEDGICRCGTIENEKVQSVDLDMLTNEIWSQLFPNNDKSGKRNNTLLEIFYGGEKIDKYCIYRILCINKAYDTNNWKINIEAGYYGDEIGDITMSIEMYNKIKDNCQSLLKKNTLDEKIKWILTLEYGYLLRDLENSSFELISIYKSDINFKNLNQNHIKKIKAKDLSYYATTNYVLPRGVVKGDPGNYRIVDGYHRIISQDDQLPFFVFRIIKK